MSRLRWNDRHGPDDFDNTAPQPPDYSFDHRRNTVPGSPSWPDKFGPANIRRAWAARLVVYAEIDGFPYPVAVKEGQWTNKVLEVKTADGPRIPNRLFTRDNLRGLQASGLLIE